MGRYRRLRDFVIETILHKTIHDGLLLALPLVIVGAISLTVTSIPLPAYQTAIHAWFGGKIHEIFNLIFVYAFSTLPLITLFTMSFSFGKAVSTDLNEILYYPVVAFCSFLIFIDDPNLKLVDAFANTQTFTSIVVTITTCCGLYALRQCRWTNLQAYLKNSTSIFSPVYKMLAPTLVLLIAFSLCNIFFDRGLKDSFGNFHLTLFQSLGINLGSTVLYAFIEHFYWFFGIHGSNVLDAVTYTMMAPLAEVNAIAAANGLVPREIYTHTFLYAFVWMGGSGALICLLLSILCFAKNDHIVRVARIAAIPSIFNIGELLMIGLPVICNPVFFLPFILVPVICVVTSGLAMQWGWVPVPSQDIVWTTPVFFSGYIVTGSVAGVILQAFNLAIGALVYRPFVKSYERARTRTFKQKFDDLVNEVIHCEQTGKTPSFQNNSELAETARNLTSDLRQAIEKKQLHLYYQPQVDYTGTIYGGEALLRWRHPQLGFVYPPLVIFLAEEAEFLDELGLSLIEMSCRDLQQISSQLEHPLKISVNVAPPQLHNEAFCRQVQGILKEYRFGESILAFEITEQIALTSTVEIMERLHELKNMGILLSMDDFGMGHSSVLYLQDSAFDIVKLDGSLVKKFLTSERSVDIISAITHLSKKFNFKVVAEFVETVEQREKLASLGCHIYQGWLYSPAVPLMKFIDFAKKHKLSC